MELKENRVGKSEGESMKHYDFAYWCTRFQHWVKKETAVHNKAGRLICPQHRTALRTRNYYTNKKWKGFDRKGRNRRMCEMVSHSIFVSPKLGISNQPKMRNHTKHPKQLGDK
jgi:hypothetical protein